MFAMSASGKKVYLWVLGSINVAYLNLGGPFMKKFLLVASIFLVSGAIMAAVTVVKCSDSNTKTGSTIYTDAATGVNKTEINASGNKMETYTDSKNKVMYMYMPAQKACTKLPYTAPKADANAGTTVAAPSTTTCTKPAISTTTITIPATCK